MPGFDGAYMVSDQGTVRSTKKGICLRPMRTGSKDKQQYSTVGLYKRGKRYSHKVHVLVLQLFVGPRPEGHKGCHKDDVTSNNALSNLYWGTSSDNQRDIVINGHSSQHKLTHAQRMEIKARRLAGESRAALSMEYGITANHVYQIVSGRVKTMAYIGEHHV